MRLIELHAGPLAEALAKKIERSDRCSAYRRISSDELKTLVGGVYGNLGQWLLTKTEEEVERRYSMIGERRAEEGIPVSQLVWCIVLVKENLWDYLRENEDIQNTSQIFGELELIQLVDQFFDRALYYAVRGHERARESRVAAQR
jgi:hypothetical protein